MFFVSRDNRTGSVVPSIAPISIRNFLWTINHVVTDKEAIVEETNAPLIVIYVVKPDQYGITELDTLFLVPFHGGGIPVCCRTILKTIHVFTTAPDPGTK